MIGVSYVSYLTGERHDLARVASAGRQGRGVAGRRFHPGVGLFADRCGGRGFRVFRLLQMDARHYRRRRSRIGTAPANPTGRRHRRAGIPSRLVIAATTIRRRCAPTRCGSPAAIPAHAPVYVLAEALDYLARYDMHAVQAHVQTLTTAMLAAAAMRCRLPTLTPGRSGATWRQRLRAVSPRAQAIVDGMARERRVGVERAGAGAVQFPWLQFSAGRRPRDRRPARGMALISRSSLCSPALRSTVADRP